MKGVDKVNSRIKELRIACGLSQDGFANKLGLKSRGKIANLEFGKTEADKEFIDLICSTFNVNQEWLETVNGDMFLPKTRNQLITDFMGDLIKEEDESFKRRLIEALAQLDIEEWELLESIAKKTLKKG